MASSPAVELYCMFGIKPPTLSLAELNLNNRGELDLDFCFYATVQLLERGVEQGRERQLWVFYVN